MNEVYKFIEDEEETRFFWNHLEKLKPNESYYFCMAARAKKLSDEDRAKYELGRSEMFYPEIMQYRQGEWRFEDFIKHIYKLQTDKRAFLTRNYLPYPDNSLICYFDPNPCDEIACIYDYMHYLGTIEAELVKAVKKGSQGGIDAQLGKMSHSMHHYKTCHPKHHTKMNFVDYDFDIKEEYLDKREEIEKYIDGLFQKFFPKNGYIMIRTSGGVHVLLKMESVVNYNRNLHDSGNKDKSLYFDPSSFGQKLMENEPDCKYFSEIMKNSNGFVPLPGSRHYLKDGNFLTVQVINKESLNA